MKPGHSQLARYLNETEERSDNSLRGKALRRAVDKSVPKTLTPYEWEQWYAEHGVPDGHRVKNSEAAGPVSGLKRWFARVHRIEK